MALDKVALALAIKAQGGGGGGGSVTVDSALSATSRNPVQNRVITEALSGKASYRAATVTLPTTGWTEDGTVGGADYPYYIDISDSDVTVNHIPIATVALASESDAVDCGLATVCQTLAGATRFFAAGIPETAITVHVSYIGA